LDRRSGDRDRPRILGAFNEPCDDWLNFFMFTMFTDRDGKYQLLALAESAFDPLSRTTKFMLTEEAFHMSVGETGVGRIVERTAQLMREHGEEDIRRHGAVDLATIQKYLNFWVSVSSDLFGGEISSNAAQYFAAGLKGRNREDSYQEHKLLDSIYDMEVPKEGKLVKEEIPLRNAMNEVLRDDYVDDCQRGVDRWNKVLADAGLSHRLKLPHRRFHRQIGIYAGLHFTPEGELISADEWNRRRNEWLPSDEDQKFIRSLMCPVMEPGRIANWIAPPKQGVKGKPFEFEYVRKV
ncbi:MAG: benzoyl-CoA 2,3-epoxidase subunit BoxB, partial [Vicinamibacteria bacterium]